MKHGMKIGVVALLLGVGACGDSPTGSVTDSSRPAAIHIMESGVVVESLGETVRLTARVVDDRGDPVSGVEVTWASSDPNILSGGQGGAFTAQANGEVVVTAHLSPGQAVGDIPGSSMRVVVRQIPVGVRMEETAPGEPFRLWQLGHNLQPSVWWVDAGGNAIAHLTVPSSWTSLDPEILRVNPDGSFTAVRDGIARLTTFHDGNQVDVQVEVAARLPVVGCVAFEGDGGGVVEECGSVALTFVDRRR